MNDTLIYRTYFSVGRFHWIFIYSSGPIVYAIGLLISAVTGDFSKFITDYPWVCLAIAITMATLGIRLAEIHGRSTIAIRSALNITDEEFRKLLEANIRRLGSGRNVVFGLAFLPALFWALTQRLWWRGYTQPAVFDIYYLTILSIILLTYAGFMFSAAVSCNQNVYMICERTPTNREYLLNEGLPILKRCWGGLILRSSMLALVMSTLTNAPILLYSGSVGLLANLGMALALTTLIFVVPHYMFHRLLERAKEETLTDVSEKLKRLGTAEQPSKGDAWDLNSVKTMLDKIYLTQYEIALRTRRTWLADLEMVVGLLAVVSSLQGILNVLVQH